MELLGEVAVLALWNEGVLGEVACREVGVDEVVEEVAVFNRRINAIFKLVLIITTFQRCIVATGEAMR